MELRKILILRSPHSGRLEGRMARIQRFAPLAPAGQKPRLVAKAAVSTRARRNGPCAKGASASVASAA